MTDHVHGPLTFTRRSAVTLVLLCAAQFLLILDISVANVALPTIGAELEMGRGALTWVLTGYVVLFGGLMVLGGRLADVFGAKRMLLIGLAVFTAGSLVAGLADSAAWLLAGRAVQGIGAALTSPSALALVTTSFAGALRTRALAVWAGVGASGAVAGVLIGGLLVGGPGWRWAFLGTVPLAAAILILFARVVRSSDGARPRPRIDVVGAILVTGSTAALVAALAGTGPSVWLAVAAAIGFTAFALVERAHPEPLVDFAALRTPSVRAGLVLMLVASALMAGNFLLGSFYLQQLEEWDALTTGAAFMPSAIATVLGAHAGGHLIQHHGPRVAAATGLSAVVVGAIAAGLWLSPVTAIAGLTVGGLGLGATFVSATTTALAHADQRSTGVLSGVVNSFHEIGAALGVAVLSAIALGQSATETGGVPAGFSAAWFAAAGLAGVTALVALVLVPAGRLAHSGHRFVH